MAVRYANTDAPCVIGKIEGYFHDHTDLELAEVLQDQESVYQSFQKNTQHDVAEASLGTASKAEDDKLDQSGRSSRTRNPVESVHIKSQLELDEAVARALQEEENQLAVTSLNGNTSPEVPILPSSIDGRSTTTGSSSQATSGGDVNPDNMTYEELQSLGETIGAESRGLSDELISYLQTSTYKVGFFSKKDKHEECVICCMPYKNRDKLINLPCKHQYHSKCIMRWLKINKACPVCTEDVFG